MPRPLHLNVQDLVDRYLAGESVNQLAKSLGVSRTVIDHRLDGMGVAKRGRGEAELLKWRRIKEQPGAVERQCAAAWKASKGRACGLRELEARATHRCRRTSPDEGEILGLLREAGLEADHQAPVGPYNVDFLLHEAAIAVEHHAGSLRRDARIGYSLLRKRVEYLQGRGLVVVVLQVSTAFRRVHGLRKATEHLVTWLEHCRSHPPAPGEYWVVACRCDSATHARVELHQRASV